MAVDYTGITADTLNGQNFRAKDRSTHTELPLKVSGEALDDYGEYLCLKMGDEKHSKGVIEEDGSVVVGTEDFQ